MDKVDLMSLNKTELKEFIVTLGFPAFRANQLYDWMHKKLTNRLEDMKNLPKDLKEKLEESCLFVKTDILALQQSSSGDTKKYLFGLYDGNAIESVWMKYKHGNSVCISSQVGCRMGCKFCASTIDGLVRNLTPSEMLSQVYSIEKETGERVSNIVIMGSGEPFDNFDTFVKFLELISNEDGQNISQRNITVSTCGLIKGIEKITELDLNVTLAISLHAVNDEKRAEIMPVAKTYKIRQIIEAADKYFEKTGRRVSYEYSLIKDVNDTKEDAMGLTRLLKGHNAHINLIPINPVKERNFRRSDLTNVLQFQQMLEKNGLNATIRREMGADIDAACGQLRRGYEQSMKGVSE